VFSTGENEELIEIIGFLYLVSVCSQKYRSYWGRIQGEGSIVSGVQTKLKPLLLMYLVHQKQIRMEKVIAPQSRGDQELKKNKPPNTTKPKPDHPKTIQDEL
jgi:hypothetical protein